MLERSSSLLPPARHRAACSFATYLLAIPHRDTPDTPARCTSAPAAMAMRVATAQLLVLLVVLLLSSATTARRPKKLKQVFEIAAAFTPEECSQIIAAASAQPQETAVLHDGKGGKQRDVNSRDSTLTWLVRPRAAGTTNLTHSSHSVFLLLAVAPLGRMWRQTQNTGGFWSAWNRSSDTVNLRGVSGRSVLAPRGFRLRRTQRATTTSGTRTPLRRLGECLVGGSCLSRFS